MTSGLYAINGDSLLYASATVWLPDGTILHADDPPAEPVNGWAWFASEDDARIAYGLPPVKRSSDDQMLEANDLAPQLQRARDAAGRFIPDDPATPENEAWRS